VRALSKSDVTTPGRLYVRTTGHDAWIVKIGDGDQFLLFCFCRRFRCCSPPPLGPCPGSLVPVGHVSARLQRPRTNSMSLAANSISLYQHCYTSSRAPTPTHLSTSPHPVAMLSALGVRDDTLSNSACCTCGICPGCSACRGSLQPTTLSPTAP